MICGIGLLALLITWLFLVLVYLFCFEVRLFVLLVSVVDFVLFCVGFLWFSICLEWFGLVLGFCDLWVMRYDSSLFVYGVIACVFKLCYVPLGLFVGCCLMVFGCLFVWVWFGVEFGLVFTVLVANSLGLRSWWLRFNVVCMIYI